MYYDFMSQYSHQTLKSSLIILFFMCSYHQFSMANEVTYPKGLRVLLVDDNVTCLQVLEMLLEACQYTVTMTDQAIIGLQMLRENSDNFDIVLIDVHMPEMDGFTLLKHIGLEVDIPVVMLSANDDPLMVMKGVKYGVVDYLVKPVRILELKNIWQHVVRRNVQKQQKGKGVVRASINTSTTDQDVNPSADEEGEKQEEDKQQQEEILEDSIAKTKCNTKDKERVAWGPNLHKKFIDAFNILGSHNAYPKKILELMNVKGLTRANVASHLQKYRLYLKKLNSQPSVPFGLSTYQNQRSSYYQSGGSNYLHSRNGYRGSQLRSPLVLGKDGTLVRSEASLVGTFGSLRHSNLIQPPSNIGKSLSSSIISPSPQNNQIRNSTTMSAPTLQNLALAVAPLARPIEHRQINPIAQQNQFSPANFNNTFSCPTNLAPLQTPVNPSFTNVFARGGQGDVPVVQNVGYNMDMVDPQTWQQTISNTNNYNPIVSGNDTSNVGFRDFSPIEFEQFGDKSAGIMEANDNVGTMIGQLSESPTGLMEAIYADGYTIDDNFDFEATELLGELTSNDGGTLDDIICGYLK